MEGAFPAERVKSFAKAIRNVAKDRPNGGSVAGVGKAKGRQEAQTACGNSDCGSVLFQESVLFDGLIERVLGSDRIVRNVKGDWVIAQDAVSHSHFGGKRLQRIEALIRVVNGRLQVTGMLLDGLQLMAHRVVIADLPEHARIGTDPDDDSEHTNDGENSNADEGVGGHDQLPEIPGSGRDKKCIALAFNHSEPSAPDFDLGRLPSPAIEPKELPD